MRRILIIVLTLMMIMSVLVSFGCDGSDGYDGDDPANSIEGETEDKVDTPIPTPEGASGEPPDENTPPP